MVDAAGAFIAAGDGKQRRFAEQLPSQRYRFGCLIRLTVVARFTFGKTVWPRRRSDAP